MKLALQSFTAELVKLADESPAKSKDHDAGSSRMRNYLANILIGAAAAPMVSIVGKKISRAVHNREIEHAMSGMAPWRARRAAAEIHTGPVFGRSRPDLPFNERPLLTPAELAGNIVQGALMSSVVQMIKDHFTRPRN